jgi:polar amino acid transport system substrate-binding protein
MSRIAVAGLLVIATVVAGCQFPRDMDGTLERLRDGGALRAGVSEHEPWVSLATEDPGGVEVGLIREFATDQGGRVEYTQGSEQDLVEALHRRELDVVIGGITDRTRWKREAAMTRPYLTTHLVVGTPRGRPLRDDERVAVEAGTAAGQLLESKTGWQAVRRESLAGVDGPAVVDDWLLDDLHLVEAETLQAREHVMLVAPGENAFMLELERFLLDRRGRALALLEEEGRP